MSAAHWSPIGKRPHHGICLPLASLGDFADLHPLIDWCAAVGFDVIQLLPLNDSGFDPSPYNALSSCALDPIYIHLDGIANDLPFRALKERKLSRLRAIHQTPSPHFLAAQPWLSAYSEEVAFAQQLAFEQLAAVKKHADARGVFLKGDIPILLSPDSVDVQTHPDLFDCTLVAGAPPDMYNPLGQKWGFPLYKWDAHRQTDFAWWRQRLGVASHFFHIYRIDHVVGFFRIWAIRPNEKATQGRYLPEDPQLWEPQGRALLKMMLDASPLLPLAEDLGSIPPIVPQTLHDLEICGTKVVRWQRRWHEDQSFIPLSEYDPLSLTTVSTPDSETLQQWWKNQGAESSLYAKAKGWTYAPTLSAEQRFELLRDAHHSASFFHINLLQEYLALFSELVWPNPDQERINLPGTVLPTNWAYRFRRSIGEITQHQGLAEAIRAILK